MIRQILLITDGCSNEGINPAAAAAQGYAEEITINVIGIVDEGRIGKHGRLEIEEIARAGGGMSRIISTQLLAQTVQMMTRKTVSHTIRKEVNKELQHILGEGSITALRPAKRAQVVQVIEDLGEAADVRVALLIDSSASMRPKLHAVKEAIRDLMLSLQSREGRSEISVFHFPSSSGVDSEIEMDVNWTRDLLSLNHLFHNVSMKGTTPTGPAILEAVRFFVNGDRQYHSLSTDEIHPVKTEPFTSTRHKDGYLSDYVL